MSSPAAELRAEAEACYERGEFEAALAKLERLRAFARDDAEVLCDLGAVLFALGRIEESFRAYADALRIEPGREDAHANLEAACRAAGTSVQAVLERFGGQEDAGATAGRVEALFRSGRLEAAYELARARVRRLPRDAEAWNDLAVIAERRGLHAEAAACIRTAAELAPDEEAVRANALRILGPGDEAGGGRAGEGEKIRLLCVEARGLGRFFRDLAGPLEAEGGIAVRHVELSSGGERIPVEWADVVWLEWANEVAAALTNRPRFLDGKGVICRLHRYEAFTDAPARINWRPVDRLVFVSEGMRKVFNRRFPQVRVAQRVITNGVDLDRYRIEEGGRDPAAVAFLAHLNHRKNLPMLLQIAARLKQRGAERQVHVAGDWQSEELRVYFEHMRRRMRLEGVILLDGWVEDVPRWLAGKSYILSTSIHESFGYGIFEGMACGLKPVVHAFPGAEEFLPEAFLFDTVEEAVGLIERDAGDPIELRRFVAERYGRRRQVEQVADLVREVAAASLAGAGGRAAAGAVRSEARASVEG